EQFKKTETEAQNKAFEIVETPVSSVVNDLEVLNELELKALSCLLLYGNVKAIFQNYVNILNEHGDIIEKTEQIEQFVYERIYLEFQEDEIQFTHPLFKSIYQALINEFQQKNGNLNVEEWMRTLPTEQQAWVL
ncbi:hypothetical protein V6O07_08380, partial [Arthrospira platensis SPKY2]